MLFTLETLATGQIHGDCIGLLCYGKQLSILFLLMGSALHASVFGLGARFVHGRSRGSSGNEGYLLAYNQKSSIFILLVSQVCRVQLSIFTTLKQTSHSILSNLICEIELIAIQSLRLSLETFRLHGAASDSWFSRVCKTSRGMYDLPRPHGSQPTHRHALSVQIANNGKNFVTEADSVCIAYTATFFRLGVIINFFAMSQ